MKKRILSLALVLMLVIGLMPAVLAAGCPVSVDYNLGGGGVSAELTSESVGVDSKPSHVPQVEALEGRVFIGWSLTNPKTLKPGQTAELVNPANVRVTEDTTFYAVYRDEAIDFHEHYVIGYPDGTFQPRGLVTRAEVATIIARAVLPGFVEGKAYQNIGGYSDVASSYWAASAIDWCAKYGAMQGYPDGTFRPKAYITREELANAIANLDGKLNTVGYMPFPDIDDAGRWALQGIYTVYVKGWIQGDAGTGNFRPKDYINRAETVRLFNNYLYRQVDAAGLADMKEHIHSGVASNTGVNGENEYMTWPDVEKGRWYYYDIIEAANDHEFVYTGIDGKSLPEIWTSCGINKKYVYNDNLLDNGGH